MIKVTRIKKPEELTGEVQKQLTEEFENDTTKRVWNKEYIRRNLLFESNHKCIYCECIIGKGNRELHIDHFHCKNKYPKEVVEWNNLNPSCAHCNKSKSNHDTYEHPIINPFEQNPQDYFYLKNYRYYSKNDKVESIVSETIDVLGINDTEEVVRFRFEQGEALINKIKDIYTLASENKDVLCSDTRKKNRVLRGCKNILEYGTRKAEYSAFMSTIISNDSYYNKLKEILKELDLWEDILQDLDNEIEEIKMSVMPDPPQQ